MIDENSIDHFNSRLTVDYSNVSKLSPAQKDKLRHYGSQAEELLTNKNFAMFVHHFKFQTADNIAAIRGHSVDDNTQRIALSNELAGIDSFVNTLKRAVYYKNKVGNSEIEPNNN
jgi:hypothetical protein